MTPEQLRRLGREWIEMALGEHASVAAFARFVLDLLSLGAPSSLVLDAIHAMEDEVHHARLCFGVARKLGGEVAGPGAMDLARMPSHMGDPATILSAAIVEGCVEETVAARCAQVARDRAEPAYMREVLVKISDDEARHSELSWQAVAWMLQRFPELRPVAEARFANALAVTPAVADTEPADVEADESYGCLSTRTKREVRRVTVEDTIRPRMTALLRPVGAG
jgi:hypothetical protein